MRFSYDHSYYSWFYVFTILSVIIAGSSDPSRVASNIVTASVFLVREQFSEMEPRYVTIASIIWVSAATGMACGLSQYEFAVIINTIVLFILSGFTGVQNFIGRLNKEAIYSIVIDNNPGSEPSLKKGP